MLGPDVFVAHVAGLLRGVLQDLLPPLGGGNIPKDETALPLREALLDLGLHLGDAHLDPLESLHGNTFPVLQEGKDDVLRQELVRMEALGFFLRQDGENLLCPLRKTLEHGVSLPFPASTPLG